MVCGPPGGITALCELIDAFPHVEGDLVECYGFDVRKVFTGEATARHALVLAERLRYDARSLYRAEILGGMDHLGWDVAQYTRTRLIDTIEKSAFVAARIGGAKRYPTPDPTWRPSMPPPPAKLAAPTIAELTPSRLAARLS